MEHTPTARLCPCDDCTYRDYMRLVTKGGLRTGLDDFRRITLAIATNVGDV